MLFQNVIVEVPSEREWEDVVRRVLTYWSNLEAPPSCFSTDNVEIGKRSGFP